MESICLCTHAARVLCAAIIIMRGNDEREMISYNEVVPIPFVWGSQVVCLRQTLDRTWISVGPEHSVVRLHTGFSTNTPLRPPPRPPSLFLLRFLPVMFCIAHSTVPSHVVCRLR